MSELSVIIPMYNAASTIERCIAPLSQMLRCGEVKEIIVVDDCSTDGTRDVLRGLPASDDLVRLDAQ